MKSKIYILLPVLFLIISSILTVQAFATTTSINRSSKAQDYMNKGLQKEAIESILSENSSDTVVGQPLIIGFPVRFFEAALDAGFANYYPLYSEYSLIDERCLCEISYNKFGEITSYAKHIFDNSKLIESQYIIPEVDFMPYRAMPAGNMDYLAQVFSMDGGFNTYFVDYYYSGNKLTSFEYNPVTGYEDKAVTVECGFDKNGNLINMKSGRDMGQVEIIYSMTEYGNAIIGIALENRHIISYEYSDGLLTEMKYSPYPDYDTIATVDSEGRAENAADPSRFYEYSYENGLITSVVCRDKELGKTVGKRIICYGNNRMINTVSTVGDLVESNTTDKYEYNKFGEITQITRNVDGNPYDSWVLYAEYDGNGRIMSVTRELAFETIKYIFKCNDRGIVFEEINNWGNEFGDYMNRYSYEIDKYGLITNAEYSGIS